MCVHKGFGGTGRVHFLMSGFSTRLHQVTAGHPSPPPTDSMRLQNEEPIYEQGVREIEHGSFTPLVFSATEGMAPAATTAYKRLASLLADKRKQEYSKTICWLRFAISFSLVRSAVMFLRVARSSLHRTSRTVECEVLLDMAICEGRNPSY